MNMNIGITITAAIIPIPNIFLIVISSNFRLNNKNNTRKVKIFFYNHFHLFI